MFAMQMVAICIAVIDLNETLFWVGLLNTSVSAVKISLSQNIMMSQILFQIYILYIILIIVQLKMENIITSDRRECL